MLHRTLCACALSLLPVQSSAGPDSVAIMLGSYHVNGSGFEEVNPGVFLYWHGAAFGGHVDLGFGGFRNSYDGFSVTATGAYPLIRTQDWTFDLFAALAHYPGEGEQFAHALGDLVPIAGLQMRYKNLFMQAIPGGGGAVDATLSYGLVFDLE